MMQVTKVWWDGEKLMAEPIDPITIYQEPAQEKDWGAVGDAHIAAIKKSSKAMVEDAVVRAAQKVMAEFEAKSDERLMKDWGPGPHEYHSLPAQQEPEFFTHCVDQPYDWSEWVCPDPKDYLMKCCDCGLVHEAEFGVVRYKSETEREDCDMVNDPNLQAVFRMRRSEQWSPADMAHRAGGLTMEQPAQQCRTDGRCQYAIDSGAEGMGHCPKGKCVMPAQQEPVAWIYSHGKAKVVSVNYVPGVRATPLYTSPPAQRPWVYLTDAERHGLWRGIIGWGDPSHDDEDLMKAIEDASRRKNA